MFSSFIFVSVLISSCSSGVIGFVVASNSRKINSRQPKFNSQYNSNTKVQEVDESSKREMLKFAIPALGIFLCNPLLSNIDNAFVGRTVGSIGLAALSPATICTDQMLYLFSFLGRATTGLASRAYGNERNINNVREVASPCLSFALLIGIFLSIFYAFNTHKMLALLNVNPILRSDAASYIYWRGSIAWAALVQAVALSVLLATRDSITPLKIVGLAAVVNVIGDALFCVWPFQLGCGGAAAATAFATLFSSGFLLQSLKRKQILPKLRIPSWNDFVALNEFTGPLLAITITRLIGFVSMQKTAMRLGLENMAAYQLSLNIVMFFLLFAEPLSQLSQTKLPALLDSNDTTVARATFKNILILGCFLSIGIGSVAAFTLRFGAPLFTNDLGVQALSKNAVPAVFFTVSTALFAVTVDGALLACKEFTYMLTIGISSMLLQMKLLSCWASSISDIYVTFALRLGTYSIFALIRSALGKGTLGRLIQQKQKNLNSSTI